MSIQSISIYFKKNRRIVARFEDDTERVLNEEYFQKRYEPEIFDRLVDDDIAELVEKEKKKFIDKIEKSNAAAERKEQLKSEYTTPEKIQQYRNAVKSREAERKAISKASDKLNTLLLICYELAEKIIESEG